MYSASAVANAFIKRAEEGGIKGLTPMKLQRLMFFAQSWYLYLNKDKPLFDDFFARWETGPVIPSIYHRLKGLEDDEINQQIQLVQKSIALQPYKLLKD